MFKFIDKITKDVKKRWFEIVGTSAGLFLALRANVFFSKVINTSFPEANNLLAEALILLLMSVIIVYSLVLLGRALKVNK